MRIRFAKLSDSQELAQLHWQCSPEQPDSFMARLGPFFLRQYYRALLHEKHSVVLCAEDDQNKLVGFISGSLNATEHIPELRRHRFKLFLGALPALLRNPRLLHGMLNRQESKSADLEDNSFIVLHGARWEYWAFLPAARAQGKALALFRAWLAIMRAAGAGNIRFEVNEDTPKIVRLHRSLGAKIIRKCVTPDGTPRLIMEYPAAFAAAI